MTTLSVIIATIPGRGSLLSRCLHSITEQDGDYEIIVLPGAGGLGSKYNRGVAEATGEYVTNIDDDDFVTPDYMERVLPLCDGVDYVGITMDVTNEGKPWHHRTSTGAVKVWDDSPADDGGYRPICPVPKGVIRRDIAARVTYGNRYADDRVWSAAIAPLVETWADVDPEHPVYRYDFWPHRFGPRSGGRDVGVWQFDESKIRRLEVNT